MSIPIFIPPAIRLSDAIAASMGKPRPERPINDYIPSEVELEALRHFNFSFDLALELGMAPNIAAFFARDYTRKMVNDHA